MSLKNWVFLVFLSLGVSLASVVSAEDTRAMRTIVVIGSGKVSAPPDKAVITLGARHTAKSASDALTMTSEAVTAILSRMEAFGIDPKDMQTASLNLNPVWGKARRSENGEVAAPIGFEAFNLIQVTLYDLGRLGGVLDQVTREGANSFSGFQFGLVDAGPILDSARKAAVLEGRRKAELYAAAIGVTLGEVLLITEDLNSRGSYPAPVMEMAAERLASVPIAHGEVSQSARVKMIFSVAD